MSQYHNLYIQYCNPKIMLVKRKRHTSKKKSDIGESVTKKELNFVGLVRDNQYKTISELAKLSHSDYKNTHRYCQSLYKKGFLILNPKPKEGKKGVPVKVSINITKNDEEVEHLLLRILKENDGRMEEEKLMNLLYTHENLTFDPRGKAKMAMVIMFLYFNKHIKKEIVITKEGMNFLKKTSRKKELKESIKIIKRRGLI